MTTENQKARLFKVPKWLKRYHNRYGRGGVDMILATHRQNPAPTLDEAAKERKKA